MHANDAAAHRRRRASDGPLQRASLPDRIARILVNLLGAGGAALFARASLQYYLHTHRLIGGAFFIEQAWFVVAFLIRRPPQAASRRLGSWLLAAAGTYGGVLFRPAGAHPQWGVEIGLGVQLLGLAIVMVSLVALGRSFGFVAADRGLVTRGPYAVIRHPVYAAYMLIQLGYVLQSMSPWNVAVLVFATGCNIGRAIAEERVLATSSGYEVYQRQVRRRLVPGLW